MRVAVTGAGGFIGRRLVRMLREDEVLGPLASLTVTDARLSGLVAASDLRVVAGDLALSNVRSEVIGDGVDVLFHLAAVPGGAAEENYELSRSVNLDASLSLLQAAAAVGHTPRVVYTSTIAVFGAQLPTEVDDRTPLASELTYGAHKLMMEVALRDLTRRGAIDGIAVRLPGIVARPAAAAGMRSAFMSDVFHALRARRPFVCPVSQAATTWAMSVDQCCWNLVHAAGASCHLFPTNRAMTLPALRLSMAELVTAVAAATDADPALVSYEPDAGLEALFGAFPPLRTPAAEAAGCRHDGDAATLVSRALADIDPTAG